MKQLLFQLAVKLLFALLTPELAQNLYEKMIAKIDKHVIKTPYTIDDIIWASIKSGGDAMQEIGDTMLDFGENYVLGTKSKVDDVLALPIFSMIRAIANIPDDD